MEKILKQLKFKKIIPIILLLLVGVLIFIYYSSDYNYPPCCDTAITIMKAKQIAQVGSLDARQLYNPSDQLPLYSSLVSTESALHIVLSIFYKINSNLSSNLVFAKNFFLIIFILPVFSLYLLVKKIYKNSYLSIIFIILLYFNYWFGQTYWLGHVAQMFGVFFLPLMIYFIYEFNNKKKLRYLIISLCILLLTFFVHVLTFLLMLIIFSSFYLYYFINLKNNKKYFYLVSYILVAIFFLLYLKFNSEQGSFIPNFSINEAGDSLIGLYKNIFTIISASILFIMGAYVSLKQKNYIIIIWILSTILLTQTNLLQTPFYADRFSEFVSIPFLIIFMFGLQYFLAMFKGFNIKLIFVIALIGIILPLGIYKQEDIKKCYVTNCSGLNPTQMPYEDQLAFDWIDNNINNNKVFIGIRKFGYYLPIVTDNPIEFPLGEKREIYTNNSSNERWEILSKYNIDFVFWDAIFEKQNNKILGATGFTNTEFNDEALFSKVYEQNGVIIYEVIR